MTNHKVEDGRVRAHETAEATTVKIHELIDKAAQQAEVGSERAQELQSVAAKQAAVAKENAAHRAAELREQAEETKKQAEKDAKKRRKAAKKGGKNATKDVRKKAKKGGQQASRDVDALKESLQEDVLPRVNETATGLAAAGVSTGRRVADQAAVRGPEVMAALRENRDPQAALDAAKGVPQTKPKKKGRKRKLLLLALVVGGAAAVAAKLKSGPKKDPWAVPAGDPYQAPTTGRDSSVPAAGLAATGTGPSAEAADAAPASDPLAAPTSIGEDPLAAPATPVGDTPEAREQSEGVEGGDAWSSARDWADNSSIPSTTGHEDTSEDLSPDHLGEDDRRDGGNPA